MLRLLLILLMIPTSLAFGSEENPVTVAEKCSAYHSFTTEYYETCKKMDMARHFGVHEPNLFGIAYDSDDQEAYLSFTLSIQQELFYTAFADRDWELKLYGAMTTRQAFYAFTRPSSPVIGRRYNPKVFVRFPYLDVTLFGHESNGQKITSKTQYDLFRDQLVEDNETVLDDRKNKPSYAEDYLSRGWDYFGVTWRLHPYGGSSQQQFQINAKKFYESCCVQGRAEEVHEWERDYGELPKKIKKRQDVETFRFTYSRDFIDSRDVRAKEEFAPRGVHFSLIIGSKGFMSMEGSFDFFLGYLPFRLSMSNGYTSELVNYHRRVTKSELSFVMDRF